MKKKINLDNIAKNYYYGREGYRKEWPNVYKKLIQYRYKAVKPFLKGDIVLELGTGDGEMTQYLFSDFKKIVGVEGSSYLIKKVKERFFNKYSTKKLELYHSLFEDFKPSRLYPTIICSHILEHLDEPVKLLVKLKKWVERNGVIIIIVPNALSLHRLVGVKMRLLRKPTDLNPNDKKIGHKRVYTPKTLKKDIKKAGLHIKSFGGYFLKPLSNKQIQESWTEKMLDAFYELGKEYPRFATEIYAVCSL